MEIVHYTLTRRVDQDRIEAIGGVSYFQTGDPDDEIQALQEIARIIRERIADLEGE